MRPILPDVASGGDRQAPDNNHGLETFRGGRNGSDAGTGPEIAAPAGCDVPIRISGRQVPSRQLSVVTAGPRLGSTRMAMASAPKRSTSS